MQNFGEYSLMHDYSLWSVSMNLWKLHKPSIAFVKYIS